MAISRRSVIASVSAGGVLAAGAGFAAWRTLGERALAADGPELDVSRLKTVFQDGFESFAAYDPDKNPSSAWSTAGVRSFENAPGRARGRAPDGPAACQDRTPKNSGLLAAYTDETLGPELRTCFASNGVLNMVAKPIPASLAGKACGRSYIAPRIWLTDKGRPRGFKYGYFEARIRFDVKGGAHPAFWLFPTSGRWTSEIDIVEYLGSWARAGERGDQYHTATHTNFGATSLPERIKGRTINGAWRRYGVLWTEKTLTFYLDRRQVRQMPNPGIHEPMYPIINLAVGTQWALNSRPGDDFAQQSHQMAVDEVWIAQET